MVCVKQNIQYIYVITRCCVGLILRSILFLVHILCITHLCKFYIYITIVPALRASADSFNMLIIWYSVIENIYIYRVFYIVNNV